MREGKNRSTGVDTWKHTHVQREEGSARKEEWWGGEEEEEDLL